MKQNLRLKSKTDNIDSKTDNIDSINSAFVYIGLFGTIIISLIICCNCACKKSPEPKPSLIICCNCVCKKSPEPKESDDSSEQPHHPAPSLQPGQDQMDIVTPPETLGRPTPFSVNQRWNTNSAQPAPSSPPSELLDLCLDLSYDRVRSHVIPFKDSNDAPSSHGHEQHGALIDAKDRSIL